MDVRFGHGQPKPFECNNMIQTIKFIWVYVPCHMNNIEYKLGNVIYQYNHLQRQWLLRLGRDGDVINGINVQ